ncbi:LytR/AlgR family response regulator transcription factor [Marinimicrobium alkaliphilum]|uniref:LytR/AlgR family response regulator transcription factor n=1 Tax=Marinimicrobium alkaliphilum TaxID=2202654 RepID=UPI000DBA165E|nr:LytTR family DNA-binding domain-containing protein [Marinimicrobium alkaliphilum]
MKILVVDDEPLARERLARMVERLDGHELVAQAANAEAALQLIEERDPDVVLLDIRMPGTDGLVAAEQIAERPNPPAVIFCTAFDEHALDAFGTSAVGYLLKPVKTEQLTQVLDKARRTNKLQRAELTDSAPAAGNGQRTYLSAKTHRGVDLIPIDNIRCLIADQKYVTVYHTEGEHLLDETLKDLEQEFAQQLVRIHRNALVAIAHIQGLERNAMGQCRVRLEGIDTAPVVSRRHTQSIRSLIQQL